MFATPSTAFTALLEEGWLSTRAVTSLLVDECDLLLCGSQHKQTVRRLIAALPDVEQRQTVLFSATQPRAMLNELQGVLRIEKLDVLLCDAHAGD